MPEDANAPAAEPPRRPLTVDELRPFFASMPSDIGSLVLELAKARYYLQAQIAAATAADE